MSSLRLVSILIPCRNEEKYIVKCLNSVLAFTCPDGVSAEILVLDGCSEDRTVELVRRVALMASNVRIVDNPGRIQSTAVNIGVRMARGDWIMRLDAHAEYPINYLCLCIETQRRTGADNVGGLFETQPGGETYSAYIVQALTTHRFGVGNSGFRVGDKEGPADTVPYGFFTKEIFARIGLLDERLVRAQDYEFNRRILASGGRIWRNPDIRIRYYNQPTLKDFLRKQIEKEAPYNAYLWYIAPYAFAYRHAITGVFFCGVVGGLLFVSIARILVTPYTAVLVLYALLATVSAAQQATRYRRPSFLLALPACFFLYHFLHGYGVVKGLCLLAIGRAPVQTDPEPWCGAGRFRAWPIREAK